MNWKGVMPAITTSFTENLQVDHSFVARHCRWLLDNGCTGIVALGSLGEGATLPVEARLKLLPPCGDGSPGRARVLPSIRARAPAEAVTLGKAASELGSDGL